MKNSAVSAVMERGLPGLAPNLWVVLLGVLAGLYLVSIYASEMVGAIAGRAGYDLNLLHEFFHDIRHAAGFMCH